jgi:hypothetical protein
VVGHPVTAAFVGALAVFVAVVVADRRRWRRSWTGYSWSGTPEEVRLVGEELRRAGLEVEFEERGGIRVRNRDRRRVRRVLIGLGIRPPRW